MYDSTQQPSLRQNQWKKERRRKEQIAYMVLAMLFVGFIFCMMKEMGNSLPGFRVSLTRISGPETETSLSMAEGKQVDGGLISAGNEVYLEKISADNIDNIDNIEAKGLGERPLAITGEREQEKPVIIVDAGHGGEDTGCLWEGVSEKEINLSIAQKTEDKLIEAGYSVIMIRDTDHYVPSEERVKLANESGADLYISIHQNAYEDDNAEGIEVWYDKNKGEDAGRLALLLRQQTVKETGAVKRQVRESTELHVVADTVMPACLIETGFLSNRKEREKLVTAEYQEQLAEGIARAVTYYFEPKTMYLTFDDGPFKKNTERVLDILKERNVKATFFLVGEYVEKNPEVAQRIVREGHAVGVHCYRHDYGLLYADVESYVQDFEKAHSIIQEVTGIDAKIFRFPGGSINDFNEAVREDIIQEMTKRGYIYYDWNASLEDAVANPQAEKLIANALASTFDRKKVIMLAHDVVYETGMCLSELLDQFPEYKMEVLTPEVQPVQF